jgi:hypothetical protein
MGKTFISILEVATQIAATVFLTPLIGPVGAALVGAGLVALESAVLAPKSPKPATTETSIKVSRPPRASGYGINRLQGAYILYETASNGYAVDVWVYHDGAIDAVLQCFVGDRKVTVKPNGFIEQDDSGNGEFGKNEDNVQVGWSLGAAIGIAFAKVIDLVPDHWTSRHRGDGCVTGYMISKNVKAKNFQTIYPSGGPNQTPMSLAMRLQRVFDWRDPAQSLDDPSTWRFSENAILHLAHYLIVRMDRKWALHFAPTLDYWTDAANDADSPVVLTGVQTALRVKADKGDTTAYLLSLNGLHVGMQIAIAVSGDNTQTETRTITSIDTDAMSVSWSGGLTYLHPQGSGVTWTSDPANPATEPRYRSCVVHSHTDAHKDVLAHILGCCDGWLSPRSDGALMVFSGRYATPTVAIGPDEIVSYTYQVGVAEEEAVNTLKVTYVSANHDYNTVDTDDWIDEDAAEAAGKSLSDNLENQMPSFSQGRRLAKRQMARVMAPYRGTVALTAAGRRAIGQRYIHLDLIEAGATFYFGPVEITKATRNLATGGVTLEWIAADPNVDAWDPATEEGNPAPIGNRVAATPLPTPSITGITQDSGSTSSDGTTARVLVAATGLDRDDVTWFARFRVQGAAVWNDTQTLDIDPSTAVILSVGPVPTGKSIEVEVAYNVSDGRLSDFSTAVAFTVAANGIVALKSDVSGNSEAIAEQQQTISDLENRVAAVERNQNSPGTSQP